MSKSTTSTHLNDLSTGDWTLLRLILAFCSLLACNAHSAAIPYGLSQNDRDEIVRILGVSTASKLLSNPYPLGGFEGFEVGFSMEWIDLRDMNRLGCTASSPGCPNSGNDNRDLNLTRLSLSKGLYHGVDVSLNFIPPSGDIDISGYGGSVRYAFFEGTFIPLTLSAWAQADFLNYGDRLAADTIGLNLVAGFFVESISLYMGIGLIESTGKFRGGTGQDSVIDPTDPLLDSTSNITKATTRDIRTFLGATLDFEKVFVAIQIDRLPESVISARLGIRL